MLAKKRKKRRPQRAKSQPSRVPKRSASNDVPYSADEITDERLENRNLKHLPIEVRDTINDLYEQAQHAPKDTIPELERGVATYPGSAAIRQASHDCL